MCFINFGFNGVLLWGDVTTGRRGSGTLWPACIAWVSQTIGQHYRSDSNLPQVLAASFYHFWLMNKIHITLKVRRTLCLLYERSCQVLRWGKVGRSWGFSSWKQKGQGNEQPCSGFLEGGLILGSNHRLKLSLVSFLGWSFLASKGVAGKTCSSYQRGCLRR